MNIVRKVVEGLLLFVLGVTRAAFLAQGIGLGVATFFLWAPPGGGKLPWAAETLGPLLMMSAAFGVGAIALHILPLVPAGSEPTNSRPSILWMSPLLLIPVFTLFLSRDLVELWREIFTTLQQLGVWDQKFMAEPMSGIVWLPISVVAYVPALEAASLSFLAFVPVLVLLLPITRSKRTRSSILMMVITQAVLVSASFVGAKLFAQLANALVPILQAERAPEMVRIIDRLQHAQVVLKSTSIAFLAPLAAFMGWAPLVLSRVAQGPIEAAVGDLPPELAAADPGSMTEIS